MACKTSLYIISSTSLVFLLRLFVLFCFYFISIYLHLVFLLSSRIFCSLLCIFLSSQNSVLFLFFGLLPLLYFSLFCVLLYQLAILFVCIFVKLYLFLLLVSLFCSFSAIIIFLLPTCSLFFQYFSFKHLPSFLQ